MTPEVVLLNPSYIYPPHPRGLVGKLRQDPLVMDLPSLEFLYPPMGLLSIAGALRRAGFGVRAIDSNLRSETMEELARSCEGARVVGISLLVANLRSVYQLVRHMKGRGYEVVVGGALPSVDPEVVGKLGLRYGIAGEGEVSFVRLCEALVRGRGRPEDVPGIIIAEGPERTFTRPAEIIEDLDPWMPDRSVLRSPRYRLPFAGPIEMALASRGCPYTCPFCYCSSPSPNSMFNRHRHASVEAVVRDVVETVRRWHPAYVEMIDETFTVDRDYVIELCRALRDEKLDLSWGAKTRIDLVDDELLEEMARAGLRKIGFGLESGTYELRREMGKDFTDRKVEQVFDSARRLGLERACTVIFGHPDETEADMERSVEMVKAIRVDYAEFHIMVLVPGTMVFERAVREGKVAPDVFDRFMRGECGYPEYAPGDMSPADMRRVHRRAVRRFYFRPGYVAQTLRRMHRPGELLQVARTAAALFAMTDIADRNPVWRLGRSAA